MAKAPDFSKGPGGLGALRREEEEDRRMRGRRANANACATDCAHWSLLSAPVCPLSLPTVCL